MTPELPHPAIFEELLDLNQKLIQWREASYICLSDTQPLKYLVTTYCTFHIPCPRVWGHPNDSKFWGSSAGTPRDWHLLNTQRWSASIGQGSEYHWLVQIESSTQWKTKRESDASMNWQKLPKPLGPKKWFSCFFLYNKRTPIMSVIVHVMSPHLTPRHSLSTPFLSLQQRIQDCDSRKGAL